MLDIEGGKGGEEYETYGKTHLSILKIIHIECNICK